MDEYEVCYNEHENRIYIVRDAATVIIGPPRVLVGKVYTMKVCEISKGGKGEWNNSMIMQFTKPLPQAPEISDFFLLSIIAMVTIKIPGVMYSTESLVTRVKVSYASAID